MTTNSRQMFVNVAVKDLQKSMNFFRQLGFKFNQQFTDENAACMVISDQACVMLLQEPFFKGFMKNAVCDTKTHTEALLALSCESRQAVDDMAKQAIAAGGQPATDPMDHGFMYLKTFHDLDGHHWEVFWMDPGHVQPAQLV